MLVQKKVYNKNGFTLIELLVVLAVLAIIALIAIPNFMGIQEQSKLKSDFTSCDTIRKALQMAISSESLSLVDGTKICSFSSDDSIDFPLVNTLDKDIVKKFLNGVEDDFKAQSNGFKAIFSIKNNSVVYEATKNGNPISKP